MTGTKQARKAKGSGGMGNHKHGTCGRAPKSPRFRFHQKREAERDDVKDKTRLKYPKESIKDLFEK
jgi:hypothetical protein